MISEVIATDRITAGKFTGVFAANELPRKIEKFPCGIIANTDPNFKPGQHWIAFYLTTPNSGEFFDSYGNPPSFYSRNFETFLQHTVSEWTFNSHVLQSTFTNVCGEYCIFYLMHRSRGVSMNNIVKVFSNNRQLNDESVYKFVARFFP